MQKICWSILWDLQKFWSFLTGTYEKILNMPHKIFPCSYCTNKYLSEDIRDWHELYQCKCKKIIWRIAFQTIDLPNIEIPDVNEEKSEETIWKKPTLTCKYCKATHSRIQHLNTHMKSCKRRQLLKFKCECNKRFTTSSNLTRHKKKSCKLKL